MTRNDGIFVRCSPELLLAVDEVRGNRTRPEFFRRSAERAVEGERRRKVAEEVVDPVKLAERAIEPRFKK